MGTGHFATRDVHSHTGGKAFMVVSGCMNVMVLRQAAEEAWCCAHVAGLAQSASTAKSFVEAACLAPSCWPFSFVLVAAIYSVTAICKGNGCRPWILMLEILWRLRYWAAECNIQL